MYLGIDRNTLQPCRTEPSEGRSSACNGGPHDIREATRGCRGWEGYRTEREKPCPGVHQHDAIPSPREIGGVLEASSSVGTTQPRETRDREHHPPSPHPISLSGVDLSWLGGCSQRPRQRVVGQVGVPRDMAHLPPCTAHLHVDALGEEHRRHDGYVAQQVPRQTEGWWDYLSIRGVAAGVDRSRSLAQLRLRQPRLLLDNNAIAIIAITVTIRCNNRAISVRDGAATIVIALSHMSRRD